MPRYYFHLHNSIEALDDEGTELPSVEAAREHAIRCARDIMTSEIKQTGKIHLSHWIEIEGPKGAMTTVRYGDCVEVKA